MMFANPALANAYPAFLLSAWTVPLLFSLLLALPCRHRCSLWVNMAPWAALPALLASLMVPCETVSEWSWLLLGARFGLDAEGQIFLFFTSLLWLLSGLFAVNYLATDPGRSRFFKFYLLSMGGNIGLILALDIASFYSFFALMSFSAYGLVTHYRTKEAFRAGRVYLYLVVLGELMLFAGFVIIAATDGMLLPVSTGGSWHNVLLALLFFGFGIKAGTLPLHVWLPLAHPVAPTPASAVLSGAMIKAGLLGWLRFFPLGGLTQTGWGSVLLYLGIMAVFYAGLTGVTQRNPKTVLAYSSISQMGLITIAVAAGFLDPSHWEAAKALVLLYALHHGLAKGALFLAVPAAQAAGGYLRGWVKGGLLLPALALAGAPLTSGMVAKAGLKSVTEALPAPWPPLFQLLLPVTSIITTLLMARFLYLVWPRKEGQGGLPPALWLPWFILIAAVVLTVFVWPPVSAGVQTQFSPAKWWPAIWPILLGMFLAAAAWRLCRDFGFHLVEIPAGDLLWLAERATVVLTKPLRALIWFSLLVTRHASASRFLDRFEGGLMAGDLPARAENHLRKWSMTGLLFLLLALTFILLLIFQP